MPWSSEYARELARQVERLAEVAYEEGCRDAQSDLLPYIDYKSQFDMWRQRLKEFEESKGDPNETEKKK